MSVYGDGLAEQARREGEAKFRGIVEYATVGIAIVQDARFRFVNPCCAAMLGYGVEELFGTAFMGYCVPEDRDRIVDFYTRRPVIISDLREAARHTPHLTMTARRDRGMLVARQSRGG